MPYKISLTAAPLVDVVADVHLKTRNIQITKHDVTVFVRLKPGQIRMPDLVRDHMGEKNPADIFDQNSLGFPVKRDSRLFLDFARGLPYQFVKFLITPGMAR